MKEKGRNVSYAGHALTDRVLDKLLGTVRKPSRYVDNEYNAVKKDHDSVKFRFALAFPDIYEVGMSHLGSHILYSVLNARPDALAERVYAPWPDMARRMKAERVPLFALESKIPIRRFDVVGFSLQHELSYTNVLYMLDLAGITRYAKNRHEGEPLVIGGGPCAFNPEPVVDFFDAFVLGDGEEVVGEIAEAVIEHRGQREDLLLRLSNIPGVYVPRFYEVEYNEDGTVSQVSVNRAGPPSFIQKRVVKDLNEAPFPVKPVVPNTEIVHDRASLELFRGCTRGCRFCSAGFIYRPVRERSLDNLQELALNLLANTGYREISLGSLSSSDYSCIQELVRILSQELAPERISLSLPSLRVDAFSVDLARQIEAVRRSSLTFAPEAGSQRLRDIINKGVTEDDLLHSVDAAFKAGWQALKLYFMIGLPTEADEDLDAIGELVSRVISAYKEYHKGRPHITVSASVFVPKPHTPFQWEPQVERPEIERRQSYLARVLSKAGGRAVKFNWHDSKQSFVEAVLSRGDRRLGRVVERAYLRGSHFDAWNEHFKYDEWIGACAEEGIDPEFYANRRRSDNEVFPWDHLGTGVSKRYLASERERSRKGLKTSDCRWHECVSCGVCSSLGISRGGRRDVEDRKEESCQSRETRKGENSMKEGTKEPCRLERE